MGVTEEEDVVSADKLVVTGEEIVILELYLVMRNVRHRWWAPGETGMRQSRCKPCNSGRIRSVSLIWERGLSQRKIMMELNRKAAEPGERKHARASAMSSCSHVLT